jgi:integrase
MMSDVDFDKSTIYIIQGKGKKDRLVPMCSRLKAILQEYLNERIRLRKTCERFFTTAQYDIPM